MPPSERVTDLKAGSASDPRVAPPKAAALVALEIAQRIARRELLDGSPLPTERELIARYGVSRAVIREAMRLLEVNGLVTIRRGAGGGASAQAPDIGTTARHFAVVLQLGGCTLHELDATLIALEPEALRLLSPSRRREAVELLQSVLAETDRTDAGSVHGFHRSIPQATANAVVIRLFDLMAAIRVRHALQAVRHSNRPAEVLSDLSTAHASHQRVLATIESGDLDRAWRQWVRHGRIAMRALAQDPSTSILDLFGPGSGFDWDASRMSRDRQSRLPKGADIVAGELRRRIVSGELAAGQPVPTEAELMRHYGLSRSPVREAIRVLEFDQLVVPLRGSHIGSRVGAPSDETVAWHFALLLECEGVLLAEVLEAYQLVLRAAAGMVQRPPQSHEPTVERNVGASVPELLARLDSIVNAGDNTVLRFLYRLVRSLLPTKATSTGVHGHRLLPGCSADLEEAIAHFEQHAATSRSEASEMWRVVADTTGPWLKAAFDGNARVSAFPADVDLPNDAAARQTTPASTPS